MTYQKGFTAVEIAIVLVVVALLAGGGFYVYRSADKQNNKSYTSAIPSEREDKAQDDVKKESPYVKPDNSTTYTVEKLGISFDVPDSWAKEPSSDGYGPETVFESWKANTVEVRLSATSTDECPQGDGAPLSHFQGYYVENGVNYLNWCPNEDLPSKYPVEEDGSVDSVGLGKVLYDSRSSECEGFFCGEEDTAKGLKTYFFTATFNADKPPFAGGTIYFISVGGGKAESVTENEILAMLRSMRPAEH